MIGLILVAAVAGFLAGISPCILPVLPVVLVAGATRPAGVPATTTRPVAVPAGAVGAGSIPTRPEPAEVSLVGGTTAGTRLPYAGLGRERHRP